MKKIIVFIAVVLLTGAMLLMIDIVNSNAVEDANEMDEFLSTASSIEEIDLGEDLDSIKYKLWDLNLYTDTTFYSRVKINEIKRMNNEFSGLKEEYFQTLNEQVPSIYANYVDSYNNQLIDLNNQISVLQNEINSLPNEEITKDEDCIIFCSTTTDKEHYQNEIENIKEDIEEVQFNSELQTVVVNDESELEDLSKEISDVRDIQEILDDIQTSIDDLQEDVDNYEK